MTRAQSGMRALPWPHARFREGDQGRSLGSECWHGIRVGKRVIPIHFGLAYLGQGPKQVGLI